MIFKTGYLAVWWQTLRPKTLPATLAPVLLGGSLALARNSVNQVNFWLALFATGCLQIAANLINDLADGKRGMDDSRVGPQRAFASGALSERTLTQGIALAVTAATGCGLALALRSGWWVVGIGVVSLWAAWAYTGGKRPYGYHGFGDVAVLLFFGPVAVGGTFRAVAGEWSATSLLLGLVPGLLGAAILMVNNIRDLDNDSKGGKRTLAVRLGAVRAVRLYRLELLFACVLPLLIRPSPFVLLVSLAGLVLQAGLWKSVQHDASPQALNFALARTAGLMLVFCLLLSGAVVFS